MTAEKNKSKEKREAKAMCQNIFFRILMTLGPLILRVFNFKKVD